MDKMKEHIEKAKKIIEQCKSYTIRLEKVEELKEGKTEVYLSTITPYSRVYLNEVFKARRNINKEIIIKILEPIIAESVKLKTLYEKNGIDYMVNYFFKEI